MNFIKEAILIIKFSFNGPKYVKELTKVMNERTRPFLSLGSWEYISPFGLIRVQKDHYGPEVHIGHHYSMLDCDPHRYGLTREDADPLYDAILSNVPGTCDYEKKMLGRRK